MRITTLLCTLLATLGTAENLLLPNLYNQPEHERDIYNQEHNSPVMVASKLGEDVTLTTYIVSCVSALTTGAVTICRSSWPPYTYEINPSSVQMEYTARALSREGGDYVFSQNCALTTLQTTLGRVPSTLADCTQSFHYIASLGLKDEVATMSFAYEGYITFPMVTSDAAVVNSYELTSVTPTLVMQTKTAESERASMSMGARESKSASTTAYGSFSTTSAPTTSFTDVAFSGTSFGTLGVSLQTDTSSINSAGKVIVEWGVWLTSFSICTLSILLY